MKSPDVVVIGDVNIDLIIEGMVSLPELGREQLVRDMHCEMGGASAITASNLARLGLNVGFVGRLGRDSFGEMITQTLVMNNVDCTAVTIDDSVRTGITMSMTYPEDYSMVTYLGTNAQLSYRDVNMDYVSQAGHLHLSSIYLLPQLRGNVKDLFNNAQNNGITTSFDPGWDTEERWEEDVKECIDYCDLVFMNEQEALRITASHHCGEALNIFGQMGATAVIKLGGQGAVCQHETGIIRAGAFPVKAVDTTGAGDSFNAGFLYQWLQDKDLRKSMVCGCACGALAVTKAGGTTAAPKEDDLKKFLSSAPDILSE